MDKVERATMSLQEAAQRLGIGRSAAYDAARRGDTFPVKRIGKKFLVPIRAFEAWLDDRDAA